MHRPTGVLIRYSLYYFLQPVMRKTLLLKDLDLARLCPGRESYTSEEKKQQQQIQSKPTICSLCDWQIVKFLVFKSVSSVKLKLDLFVSSLYSPFILKNDQHSISPNMDNTLSRNRWREVREYMKSIEQCALPWCSS